MNKVYILSQIGQRIRKLRTEKNISQEELADLAGLDRTYVGGIERGERNVSLVNLEKISIALKINLSDLLKDYPSSK